MAGTCDSRLSPQWLFGDVEADVRLEGRQRLDQRQVGLEELGLVAALLQASTIASTVSSESRSSHWSGDMSGHVGAFFFRLAKYSNAHG